MSRFLTLTIYLILLTISLFSPLVRSFRAQQVNGRGDGVGVKTVSTERDSLYNESHALIIGISDYKNGWEDLPGVKDDVPAVKKVLEKHSFKVHVEEEDLTGQELDAAIKRFIRRYGEPPRNRLLIYFAGHGYTHIENGVRLGYIVPMDAPYPSTENIGLFKEVAVSMDQIEAYARKIASKHVLFIFDSCFAGTIFDTSRGRHPPYIRAMLEPVRQFITAGNADQEVPNRSIFREQFVEGLEGMADTDRDGYITGSELGMFLQRNVTNYTKGAQTPQWGKIKLPQLNKGDFIFELVKTNVQQSDTTSSNWPASNPSLPEKMPSPLSTRKSFPLKITYEGPSYCILGNFSGGSRIVSASVEISGTLSFRVGLSCKRPGPRRLDAFYVGVGSESETALWSEQFKEGVVINPSRPGIYGHTRFVRFTLNGVNLTDLAKLKVIVKVDNTIMHRSGGSTQVPVYWYSKEGILAQH